MKWLDFFEKFLLLSLRNLWKDFSAHFVNVNEYLLMLLAMFHFCLKLYFGKLLQIISNKVHKFKKSFGKPLIMGFNRFYDSNKLPLTLIKSCLFQLWLPKVQCVRYVFHSTYPFTFYFTENRKWQIIRNLIENLI